MNHGNKIIIIFISILFSIPDRVVDLYNSGISLYNDSYYNIAIRNFESIIDNGWYSPELLYNLGNAYYRQGDIPNSIWAYEQSLIIDSKNKDTKFNLDIVKLESKDTFNYPEPPKYIQYYFNLE